MRITEITMCAIRDFSRLPIDSALISSPARRNGGGGGGGGWRRSITSRFISVVLRGPLFPRIRNCEMIVGLVADNLAARFSCGSLRFSPLVHRPSPPPHHPLDPPRFFFYRADLADLVISHGNLVVVAFRGQVSLLEKDWFR